MVQRDGWKKPVQVREVAPPASYLSPCWTTSPSTITSSPSSSSAWRAACAPRETRPIHSRRAEGVSAMMCFEDVGAGREESRGTRMGERE